jgi:hypothetical protein
MPTIIDGSGSATFQTPLPVAQGGTGGTTSATAAANLSVLQLGTAQATTSGTSIDFTGIPSGVKRITVMFNGVSLSGTADLMVRAGSSGGIETTGYEGVVFGNGIQTTWASGGFQVTRTGQATSTYSGTLTLTNLSGNLWIAAATMSDHTNAYAGFAAGRKTLSSSLDRVRITATNGTDTFDAGSVNIMWEF